MPQILFFALPFFGYEQHIISQMEKIGGKVHYVSGRKGRISDFLISFSKNQSEIYKAYIQEELERLPLEQIDTMLVIKGVNLTGEHMEYIRSRNPHMKKVLYQWDSLSNFDFLPLIPYFDRALTFDFRDAQDLNMEYLPLFFTEDINPLPEADKDIDILLVGTFLPERYEAMLHMGKVAKDNNLKMYSHIFVAPSYYIKKQILGRNKLKAENKDLRITSIKREKLIELYRRSKTILDVSNKNQTGMSMRVIESYGMNKKLITSNPAIEKDPYVCEMMRLPQNATEAEIVAFVGKQTPKYVNRERLSIANWVKQLIQADDNI